MSNIEKQLEDLRKRYESQPDESRYDNVGALSRYFIWADKMRYDFESLIKNKKNLDEFTLELYGHIYLSYWYGALYVLIEGWRTLNLEDENIDRLLSSPYVDLLRRYRNAVFHYQRNFSDKRFMDLMVSGMDSVKWIRELHKEFGRYFVSWWKTNTKQKTKEEK